MIQDRSDVAMKAAQHGLLMVIMILMLATESHAQDSVVVISEIHYNPVGATDDVEFVELHNLFAVDVDLSNWALSGAVDFDFPSGTKISAGGYLIVARNPSALQSATGYSSALGPWTGALNNAGEKVKLVMDAIGSRTMDEVEYSDGGQWPAAADGSGASLEKIKTTLPGDKASSWSWSQASNGTPGAARASTELPRVALNEIQAVANPAFFVEIHNYGSSSVNLNGYVISSSDNTHADKTLSLDSLAVGAYSTVNAATLGYTPIDGEKLFLHTPSKALVVDSIKMGTSAKARFPNGTGRFHRPTVATPGAANAVSVSSDIVINEIFYNGYPDPGTDGTPASYDSTTVINYSDSWRYENTGAGQSQGWANAVHNAWPSGAALLGKETNIPNLSPQTMQTLLYTPGQMAYYFEKEFSFSGSTTEAQIRFTHKIDDGAVFYLNGVELGRYHMPSGTVNSSTQASGAIDLTEGSVTFNASSLVVGSNRLSVEVHQGSTTSSDMVFGLQADVLNQTSPATPGLPFTENSEEWIELYNKGTTTVSLGGWKLDDAVDYDFLANTSIAPGGYLLIAKDPAAFAVKYPGITVVGPWSGTLANSGERIQLEDNNGNLADEVTYFDGGRWSGFADGGGCSLELKDSRSDNTQPESWAASSTSGGWNTYTYRAVATSNGFGLNNYNELILGMLESGEFLLDDVSVIEDPDGAAVQFISNGNFSSGNVGSSPSGWRAVGNHGLHGETVIVSDGGNKVLKVVATGASREYHNQLQTTFANGQTVVIGQTYEISYRAKWLRGDSQVNTRLYFDYLSNTKRIEVSQQWGTPGAVNSSAVVNAGPIFSNLSHSPTVPSSGQSVTVDVALDDPDGISSARIRYRSNNNTGFGIAGMSHQGGGVYRGVIPGFTGGTLVQFYIEATDNHGSAVVTSYFPAAAADSRAMIQWQDNQANTATLHNLRVLMRPSDRQTMYTDIHRMSNYRFPATLIVDESEVYYNVGVRLKGSAYGRNNNGPDGLNLGFDPMQPYNGIHTSISIERGTTQSQFFAKHLMSNAGKGLASMYDDPIRLVFPSDSLGNASKTGIALVSAARYSSAWRKGQFKNGNDGTLYNLELLYNPTQTSGAWKKPFPYNHTNGKYEFADLPLGKETYRWGFQIRSNLKRDNYEPLINTAKSMGLGGSAGVTELEKYIDVNQWARTWAWLGLVGNTDLYTRVWEHNYRMFSRPSDDRLVALPWDLDGAFALGTNGSLIGGKNLGSYLNQPTVKRLFLQHVHQLCQTTFTSSYASPWASHFQSKTGLNFGSYPGYISNRCNYANSQLPANVNFVITSNGGSNFSVPASSSLLEGDGWIDVASVQINGVETEVNWVDDNSWQITVPLAIGANAITLTAHNLEGAQVGTDAVTITNTSTTDLASPANLVLTEMMYHPTDPTESEQLAGYLSDDDFEFIELHNTGANTIDLSGCNFTAGITYTFPNGVTLISGARIILARNIAAFTSRYGSSGKQVVGPYTGKLSNKGGTVTLVSASAATIFTLTYDDANGWTDDADGNGYTLVNLKPTSGTDLNLPVNWSPSRDLNGGSGVADLFTYNLWLAQYPQLAAAGKAGEDDDFDGDEVTNFEEFAFHSDPTDGASLPIHQASVESIDPGTGTASYFIYSYTRPIAAPSMTYTPQSSMTLNADWDSNPATVEAVFYQRTRNGNTETMRYRTRSSLELTDSVFLRWHVQRP